MANNNEQDGPAGTPSPPANGPDDNAREPGAGSEHKQPSEPARTARQDLDTILDNMLDTFYQTDRDGRLLLVSPSVKKLIGFKADSLLGLNVGELFTGFFSRQRFLKALAKGRGVLIDYEIQLRRHDRTQVWVSANVRYRRDERGRFIGLEGTVRDIGERKRAEVEQQKLSSMLEQTADSVLVTNHEGMVEYVNPAFVETTGFSREEVLGRRHWLLRSEKKDGTYYEWIWKTIAAGHPFRDVFVSRKKDGSLFYEDKTITPVKDDSGQIKHYIATGKDITQRMQVQGRLNYPAHHDVLTELPNLALFTDRLEHAIERKRESRGIVAVLSIDLDRFKAVNATFTHHIGDQALQAMSERLRRCVRDSDTVARIGGDEFAVILEEIPQLDHVAPVVRKVLKVLSQPFELGERKLHLTSNIGISLFPQDGEDAGTLIKNASVAMYRAKEQGRNSYRFFSSDVSAHAFERLSLETSLRHALEHDEFVLYYQPQVDTTTGRVEAMEALLRWQHRDLGLVAPADFLPILEDTDLIVPIGEWILRTACRQALLWHKAGHRHLRLSVNLTKGQFSVADMPSVIKQVLTETGLDPHYLELEFFEGILVQHPKANVLTFRELQNLGVKLAIDDFGAGVSSISYLARLPIETVKIDRTFIGEITRDPSDAAVVRAAVALARALNLRALAKGVEREDQVRYLRSLGCHLMQGYFFSPPRPASDMDAVLASGFRPQR